MIRLLQPWHTNTRKRLVKSPKLYFRDSGILHSLMRVHDSEQLFTHSKLGASWEGFALECVARLLDRREIEPYFWATHTGAELDLFFRHGGGNWGVEFKFADAPRLTKSMRVCSQDLDLRHLWVVTPGRERYRLDARTTVLPVRQLAEITASLSGGMESPIVV